MKKYIYVRISYLIRQLLKTMTTSSEFIAQEREILANKLSESQIHREVVANVINMNVDIPMKVEILTQSIPDLAVIYNNIKVAHMHGQLSSSEYATLIENLLSILQQRARPVKYDPRKSITRF